MIDHLSIQCGDVAASARFYDRVLAAVDVASDGLRGRDGLGTAGKPVFWIGPRSTGDGFREVHIAFAGAQ